MSTVVDDTVRDIFYALRTFKRAPLVAFTIVSTVALGLGLVAAVFTVLNALVFRVDAVPDVQEMFAVEGRKRSASPRVSPATSSTRSVVRPPSSPTPTRNCPISTAASTGG